MHDERAGIQRSHKHRSGWRRRGGPRRPKQTVAKGKRQLRCLVSNYVLDRNDATVPPRK